MSEPPHSVAPFTAAMVYTPLIRGLPRRLREPEAMDDPSLDEHTHAAALGALQRINWLSRSVGTMWAAMHQAMAPSHLSSLRVLDVGTGSGDVPLGLWRRARRCGLTLEIAGCDASPRAVEQAQSSARQLGASARFFQLDAVADPLPTDYDIVMCSLFLHHLSETHAITLLSRMAAAARRAVIVSDLIRNRLGLLLAAAGTQLVTREPIVHADGVRSVRGAFTIPEVRMLAECAGLRSCHIARRWPERYVLLWRRGLSRTSRAAQ